MAEVFDLSCLSRLLVPESKLSHHSRANHTLVPKFGHYSGKNIKNLSGSNSPLVGSHKRSNGSKLTIAREEFYMFYPRMMAGFRCETVGGSVVVRKLAFRTDERDTNAGC